MTMGGGGNDAFNLAYLGIEIACFVAWIVAIVRRTPWLAFGAAVLAGVLLPIIWHVGWPPASGLDGAGRIVFGAPPSLLNAIAGAVVARRVGAWVALVPLASAAFWVWFLFS